MNTCICCGVIIPEGRQVCPMCEGTAAGKMISGREQEQREQKPMTHADRIRAMTDEELERFLGQHSLCSRVERCPDHGKCHKCVLDWLKQPKEGAE